MLKELFNPKKDFVSDMTEYLIYRFFADDHPF